VLHSPSIKAAKFWPGELGRFANFAVVCARLVIDDQDYGIQFFFVPIRDMQTHLPIPGVEVGDLGSKLGYNSKDNGFLLFKQYRIPRTYLLMKYCQVSKEGQISLSGDPRLMFAVMLCMRMWIVCIVWRFSAYATIIAGRYAVTRRQFLTLEKGVKQERKLMDYQAHAVKLVGTLAQSITMNLAQNHLNEYYFNFL
jgi:acyl-CoA oxidase